MDEKWRELQSAVEHLESNFKKAKHRMNYSERFESERDIRIVKEEAKRQRDAYVRWFWTGY